MSQIQTSDLVLGIDPDAVLVLGDEQYETGSLADFNASYDPTWGRFFGKSYPVPGNHEYDTKNAQGYFAYFGARGHGPNGYYSFDLGAWHIDALNSSTGARPSPAKVSWLKADLAADHHTCQLAYWHHPLWSARAHKPENTNMKPFWDALQADGVDVVLNGHVHNYQRFAPMLADGSASSNGIREFIVGTGGEKGGKPGTPLPTSEASFHGYGVLDMTLKASSYDWTFLKAGGGTIDQGSTACH